MAHRIRRPRSVPARQGLQRWQSDKILIGLTASYEVVIKSWKPRIIPSSFGDCVVTAGRDQRASSGSLRIAIIIRLCATILIVDNNVFCGKQAYDFIC